MRQKTASSEHHIVTANLKSHLHIKDTVHRLSVS